ncbi:MAG TPA: phosphate signaling complex protein PhoU [Stackebrandtia sp.]|jgi:phosphate transport system protein|uniref:phosphate signaling complex protein PhoU n=1 Tax=Stackebrandtia sp. TaxID=2023065 RepID=UPI002D33DA90|nr:phosphate signaling complex protein PhoU [Stackebrandtia sp.]HZE37402.1 phosphate signaling complex protein PhoU [Stackebrandtia sp.]
MRDNFHADLDALNGQLVAMSRSVADAMRTASAALVDFDPDRADAVIAGDSDINALQFGVDDRVLEIMTRRQPVASDLRFMLSCIRITTDLERMGDMASHVAKLARRVASNGALTQTVPIFRSMAAAAGRIADKTTQILATRDQLDATQLDLDDDEMDALYARLLGELASGWEHGAEAAVDVAMLGRSYERYSDHAVRIGHQVVYLVTGDIHLDRPQ